MRLSLTPCFSRVIKRNKNSEFVVPNGHDENSPAFQRRVTSERERVPKRRLTRREFADSPVPSGLICRLPTPGVETPGYCQKSLRDRKAQPPALQPSMTLANSKRSLSVKPIFALIALVCCVSASPAQERTANIRFETVDIYVDSGAKPLAAYQLEFRVRNVDAKIVGVEGGSHAAFREPPFYDPKAIQQERIILAAFNTSAANKLPKNKTRVATIHLQISGSKEPEFTVKLKTAASVDGRGIAAEVTLERKEK